MQFYQSCFLYKFFVAQKEKDLELAARIGQVKTDIIKWQLQRQAYIYYHNLT